MESDDVNIPELLTVIKYIRKHCCSKDVNLYNEWIPKVKSLAVKKNLLLFWNDIASGNKCYLVWYLLVRYKIILIICKMCYLEKLGLISRLENPESNVYPNEAVEFLKLKENEDDSLYGSMNTNSIDDEWVSFKCLVFQL